MAPEIRYARTSDGVSIAYSMTGRGPVLLNVSEPGFTHADLLWRNAEYQPQVESTGRVMTLVQFDPRGFGMSDREIDDFSLAAMVRDIGAVADAIGADRFAIQAWGQQSMPALSYAATHGDRVVALALRDGVGRGDHEPTDEDIPLQLARENWDLYAHRLADRSTALSVSGLRQVREMIKQSASRATFIRYAEQRVDWDVFDDLSRVTMPVLVTNDGILPNEASRCLAAALPDGALVANSAARGERLASDGAVKAFLARAFAAGQATTSSDTDAVQRAAMTPREIEILGLVVSGKSGREIASELVLSPRTVERHIANIYRKTNTHGRAQLAAFAVRHSLG